MHINGKKRKRSIVCFIDKWVSLRQEYNKTNNMKIVFATNNKNKLKEIKALVPSSIEVLSLADIGCFDDIPETSNTLEGNALIKAEHVYRNYGYSCFSDDTGLLVDALNGEPGVYSARYAGENSNSEENMKKLLFNLEGISNRKAHFETVIALILDGERKFFSGVAKGEITTEKSGQEGFGYDPIFQPLGFDQTFAEMTSDEKGKISHRGKAVEKLVAYLNSLER
jgi:XTP/dITP diphosphohydrolase